MAVADATKCRKLGSNTDNTEYPGDGDIEDKFRNQRTVWFRFQNMLRRRYLDVIGLSIYIVLIVIGHGVVTCVLLQPPETLFLQIFRPLYWFTFVLFHLSWMGVVYHGPGRPPTAAPELGQSQLPEVLAGALDAGQSCRAPEHKFSAADGFCDKCECWKPILTYHCKSCNQCSVWMDHHCYLTGQCIGFRNSRCFVVWLFYGVTLMMQLGLLTVRCLWLNGWPQDAWSFVLWIGWFAYLVGVADTLGGQLRNSVMRAAAGWPSKVLFLKFKGLHKDAMALESEAQKLKEFVPHNLQEGSELRAAHNDLRSAVSKVQFRHPLLEGLLWGPFLGSKDRIATVFGEPMSWRWCLPLRAGGTGNPFQPAEHSTNACDAWTGIAAAMKRGRAAIVAATPLKQASQNQDTDMFNAPCRMMMEVM